MKQKLRLMYFLFAICSLLFAILLTGCGEEASTPTETIVTITFDSNGGSKVTSINLDKGAKLPASYLTGNKVPKYSGNRFDGWLDGSTPVTAATTFSKSTELTAQWVRQITVKFSLGEGVSGNPPRDVTIDEGTALGTKYPTPSLTGWEFEGWFNNGTQYTNSTEINTEGVNFTLTAQWKKEIDLPDEQAQAPDIHPGLQLFEKYPDGISAKAGEQFTITGLSAVVERGKGVLSAQWYRATTENNSYVGTAVGGKLSAAGTSTPHELSLKYTGTEPEAGEFWYWVEVTNYDVNASIQKTATSRTMNQVKVTVTE